MNIKKNINTSQTSEKFRYLAEEIVAFLADSLQKIDVLDKEVFEKNQALLNPKEPNLIQPGELELQAKYRETRKIITDAICSKPQGDFGFLPGKPSRYDYLNNPNIIFDFIMKSANRAIVEIEYDYFTLRKDQFVIKKIRDDWKIDSKKLLLGKVYKEEI